jgi:transcriptional regulator with XRE-family HTH domain
MYVHDIDLKRGWGKRLTAARKAKGLTQQEVGDLLGCRNTTIYKWEKEQTRPGDKDLTVLQQLTGIRKAWIAFGEAPMESDSIDVTGFLGERVLATIEQKEIFDMEEAPSGSFMSPAIEDGDLLFLGKPTPIKEGEVYLVNTNEGARRVGRLFSLPKNEWALYSDQDLEQPGTCLPISIKESDFVGRVTGVVRKVKSRKR